MDQYDEILGGVSRETREKLDLYVALLLKWNKAINLISRSTEEEVWRRHIVDSLQIANFIETDHESWLDLGSGGGLPGLVVAAKAADTSKNAHVTLVESDQRKCAFLAAAADAMGLSVTIACRRIEESDGQTYDVISARALASLSDLLELAMPYRHDKTICIFPKGAKAASELEATREKWTISYDLIKSRTDPLASIFKVQEYARASK